MSLQDLVLVPCNLNYLVGFFFFLIIIFLVEIPLYVVTQ